MIKLKDILLVSMPPEPDDGMIQSMQDRALRAMERFATRGLVLDISAVEIMDSFFARTVVETARMIQLMGGRTIISGMRPAVAITATQLGLSLDEVETALNLERAVDLLSVPTPASTPPSVDAS